MQDRDGNATNLLPQIQKAFDARKTCACLLRPLRHIVLTNR